MGHATMIPNLDADAEYRLLQERLDRNVTGAPDSAAMMRVLRLLFTPEEAHIARRLPQLDFASQTRRETRTSTPTNWGSGSHRWPSVAWSSTSNEKAPAM